LKNYFLDNCVRCGHNIATHLHEFWIEEGYQVGLATLSIQIKMLLQFSKLF
jgi:hypothetical protein